MDYPKYIEFADGCVVVFSNVLAHSQVAKWVGREPVSAGMVSFPTRTRNRYRFFGCSSTLNLDSNGKLVLADTPWHGGLLKGSGGHMLLFSTSRDVATRVCVDDKPLGVIGLKDEYGNVALVPQVQGVDDEILARFSGVLECGAFCAPVSRGN